MLTMDQWYREVLVLLAILAVRERFFLGGFGAIGPFIVSLLFTLLRTASAVLVAAFSFSVDASWDVEVGLLTSTVILRLPSRGVNVPTAPPDVGFRSGLVGKISEL